MADAAMIEIELSDDFSPQSPEKREKIEAAAEDSVVRFEPVMKELAEEESSLSIIQEEAKEEFLKKFLWRDGKHLSHNLYANTITTFLDSKISEAYEAGKDSMEVVFDKPSYERGKADGAKQREEEILKALSILAGFDKITLQAICDSLSSTSKEV